MIRRLLPLSLLVVALLALPVAAQAKTHVAVAIGDQSPNMFSNPAYKALHLKKTRYTVAWNAASRPAELAKADAFLKAAMTDHVKVLMHITTDDYTPKKAKLPSVAQYKTAVTKLIKRYKPFGVKDWGAWNEANNKTEPTYDNPKRAAQYYKTIKSACKGCTIVALDVLDQAGVEKYISKWLAAAGSAGHSAKVFGIHNYSEVNRRLGAKRTRSTSFKKYPGTPKIIAAVHKKAKHAKFWYTETGGVVKLGAGFPCNTKRATSRNTFMFNLAKKYDSQIQRLYTFSWFGTNCSGRYDYGLVNDNGALRPAYNPFKKAIKNFDR